MSETHPQTRPASSCGRRVATSQIPPNNTPSVLKNGDTIDRSRRNTHCPTSVTNNNSSKLSSDGHGILPPPSPFSPDPRKLPNPATFHNDRRQHQRVHEADNSYRPLATTEMLQHQAGGILKDVQQQTRSHLPSSTTSDKCNSKGDGEKAGGEDLLDEDEAVSVHVSGSGNIPGPAMSFAAMAESLGGEVTENIGRCGYVNPTAVQKNAMPICLAGRDLMACAQTGSGKTAAFCLPIISCILRDQKQLQQKMKSAVALGQVNGCGVVPAYPLALILSPTRELASQIYVEAQKFAQNTGVRVAVVYGGTPVRSQMRTMARGGAEMLVATPGRLSDLIGRQSVSVARVRYLVIDEADRMLDMGFEPQIRAIVEESDMPPPTKRQTMLFSATFPADIQKLAAEFLHDYVFVSVGTVGSSTAMIEQKVEYVNDEEEKRQKLLWIVQQESNKATNSSKLVVVFVETKRGVDNLREWLYRRGCPATSIHGDKSQEEREWAMRAFKSGKMRVLVATDVASRGLDISGIGHVINYDLPKDIESYVHRIGRTGRAGRKGVATSFFSDKNAGLAMELVQLLQESKQQVPPWLCHYSTNHEQQQNQSGRRRSRAPTQ